MIDHRLRLVPGRRVREPLGPGVARDVVGDHDEPPVGRAALHGKLHEERSGDGCGVLTDDRDGVTGVGPEVDLDRHVAEQGCGFDDWPQFRSERSDVDSERDLAPGRAPAGQHPKRVAVGGFAASRARPSPERRAGRIGRSRRRRRGVAGRHRSRPSRWRTVCTPRRRDAVTDGGRGPRAARPVPAAANAAIEPTAPSNANIGWRRTIAIAIDPKRLTTAPVTPHPPTTDSVGGDGGMIGATGSPALSRRPRDRATPGITRRTAGRDSIGVGRRIGHQQTARAELDRHVVTAPRSARRPGPHRP